jgi:hypothetical protein
MNEAECDILAVPWERLGAIAGTAGERGIGVMPALVNDVSGRFGSVRRGAHSSLL